MPFDDPSSDHCPGCGAPWLGRAPGPLECFLCGRIVPLVGRVVEGAAIKALPPEQWEWCRPPPE